MKNYLLGFLIISLQIGANFSNADSGNSIGSKNNNDNGPIKERCEDYNINKRAMYGDLHVHTNFSFDAYFFNNLNGPDEAYQFAKGEVLGLPVSQDSLKQGDTIQLDRPLDFAAVTDHAEFIGGLNRLCELGGVLAKGRNPLCNRIGNYIRDNVDKFLDGGAPDGLANLQVMTKKIVPSKSAWAYEKEVADQHNQACRFTTFSGYEFSSNKVGQMAHRNVIFNGDKIPDDVIQSITKRNDSDNSNDEWRLFDTLEKTCGKEAACDYVTIPHNSNLSDGRMFPAFDIKNQSAVGRGGKALTKEDAQLRAKADRLIEIYQHKGSSECAPGLGVSGLQGEESGCEFEILKNVCEETPDICASYCVGDENDPLFCQLTSSRKKICEQVTDDGSRPENCTAANDYVQNAFLDGLLLHNSLGVNPYKAGFIASTDTHNGTPGAVSENFKGHGGILENDPAERLGKFVCTLESKGECLEKKYLSRALPLSSGGLAAVWAEENTRDAIFSALKQGESFGTSGPRIKLRMFSGWNEMPESICDDLSKGINPIAQNTYQGVPMGADMLELPDGMPFENVAPYFVVWAEQDSGGMATPLQRIEIIKGWVDKDSGKTNIKTNVLDSHENYPLPNASCEISRTSQAARMCKVWKDPDFHPEEKAFYYARTLENPTCRWNTRMCIAKGVDCQKIEEASGEFSQESGFSGYEGCCRIDETINSDGKISYTAQKRFTLIQERAWGSPSWYKGN